MRPLSRLELGQGVAVFQSVCVSIVVATQEARGMTVHQKITCSSSKKCRLITLHIYLYIYFVWEADISSSILESVTGVSTLIRS